MHITKATRKHDEHIENNEKQIQSKGNSWWGHRKQEQRQEQANEIHGGCIGNKSRDKKKPRKFMVGA